MALPVYPRVFTDREWALAAPLLPLPTLRGRSRSVDQWRLVDGPFYVL